MKLHLHITYGWLSDEYSDGIVGFDNAIENCVEPFGFRFTGSRIDKDGVRDLSFEADEFQLPE